MKTISYPTVKIQLMDQLFSDFCFSLSPKIQIWDILTSGRVIFDTKRMSASDFFFLKSLSIGDFDLYCATAYQLARRFWGNYGETSIVYNRINRDFELSICLSKTAPVRQISFYQNGNCCDLENEITGINAFFELLSNNKLNKLNGEEGLYYAKTYWNRIYDSLNEIYRAGRHYYDLYWKIHSYVAEFACPIDVLLVVRKMLEYCEDARFSKSRMYDTFWMERNFRGLRRNYVTFIHPELLY